SGRRLYRLVPRVGPTGLAAVAPGVGDDHAVSGEPRRSPGRGGGPRAHRLEVSAESRADGPGFRLFGPERMPGPPAGGGRPRTPPRQAAGARPGPGPAPRRGPAAHRLDACPRRDPGAEPARTRGGNAPGRLERGGDGRARLAPSGDPAGVVRAL